MTLTTKALLLLGGLAMAACNNPRPDMFGGGGTDGFGGDTSITTGSLGDPNDPASVAHFQQRIGDRVFFDNDSSDLTPEGRSTLQGQAAWLRANPQFAVLIEGHADERGTREYNVALGARRADTAQRFLIAEGVGADRVRTVSYGKERPVEACAAPRCWNQNRRAVTVVSGGAAG